MSFPRFMGFESIDSTDFPTVRENQDKSPQKSKIQTAKLTPFQTASVHATSLVLQTICDIIV